MRIALKPAKAFRTCHTFNHIFVRTGIWLRDTRAYDCLLSFVHSFVKKIVHTHISQACDRSYENVIECLACFGSCDWLERDS